ncbi:hypothetical protein FRC07_002972 [Ceratobasidium sp. 392]|nr:hypothetical protein FRC07_002972 [Ceratobasidium sp. 392]
MGWSWTVPAGIPEPPPLKPLSVLETEWGRLAIKYAPVDDFKLTEPILRYLCRKYKIYNVGLSSARMIHDLNEERLKQGIVDAKGNVVTPAPSLGHSGKASVVSVAKAEYYLSKGKDTTLLSNSNHEDLLLLCEKFSLPYAEKDTKDILAHRLLKYHKKIRVDIDEETNQPASKNPVAWLGSDVLREVKADMDDTCLPSWLKAPPKNFATVSHGKIGAEEYKSLMLVSFTVTLVRLWGHSAVGPFREALDNFLHLSLAIRILSYQTTTKPDDQAFDHHYRTYLDTVKLIYPHCSITTVQHLGLHIPYFLRNLGPAARFNENPAEMFIGMLQDIPTNWKIGDLGVTLHNEFNMAADLQGLLKDPSVIQSLGIVGDSLTEYIRGRYPGRPNELLSGWQTVHQGQPFRLDDAAHILFRSIASDSPIHGRIESILEEPRSAVPTGSTPRITLLVRRFKPLNSADHFLDPYGQHPVIGIRGYQIAQLCYREFLPTAFIIEPRDIVCHIATCDYHDADLKFLTPCVVVISLDLRHALPA